MKAPSSVFHCQHCLGSAVLRPEPASRDAQLVCIVCGKVLATVEELEDLLRASLYGEEKIPDDDA